MRGMMPYPPCQRLFFVELNADVEKMEAWVLAHGETAAVAELFTRRK